MKAKSQSAAAKGFTLIEAMVIAVILGMVFLFIMPSLQRPRSKRINCTNNLKQVGLAFRTWALDHNDKYPAQVSSTNAGSLELLESGVASSHFRPLSNELSTPKIMVCPADTRRKGATRFGAVFDDQHLSYFVGVDAAPTNAQMFLAGDRNVTNGASVTRPFLNLTTNQFAGWTEELHGLQGNVGLADGSVQQFSTSRLRDAIQLTGVATNRLVMP